MILEFRDVLVQGRGVHSVLFQDHLLGGEPSNGSASDVPLFEGFVESSDEV